MKKYIIRKYLLLATISAGAGMFSCSLEEHNPSANTYEVVASASIEGYRTILNNIYFGMERRMYGHADWIKLTEAGTDLWTNRRNDKDEVGWFKYGLGGSPSDVMKDVFNPIYDGIGSCNLAIEMAPLAPYGSEEARNADVAEAYFMRGMYYYNLVEQMGAVTVQTTLVSEIDLAPGKTDPLTVYREVIIPDLEFAAEWLPVGDRTTRPSKKSAMGFLLRAYLQSVQYDDTKTYAQKALDLAQDMIEDLESGGTRYSIRMYTDYADVFKEENNWDNTEALWKHRYVWGGGSNAGYVLNDNVDQFYCRAAQAPGRKFDNNVFDSKGRYHGGIYDGLYLRQIWGGRNNNIFMPTQHLLSRYIQADGSLDPRFHKTFQTFWDCNEPISWSTGNTQTFDRTADVIGTHKPEGSDVEIPGTRREYNDSVVLFLMPGDELYDELVPVRLAQPYIVVDYRDVYDDATKSVKMTYTRVNHPRESEPGTNPFIDFYPSLMKHNSSNFHVVRYDQLGNLNATFMMRSPEIYLLAAEADIYVNGGSNAIGYLNKVRERAGAIPLTGTATIDMVLDERARELCGEYTRWYDLKRTGKLSENYLQAINPDVGIHFKPHFTVRPFPVALLAALENGGAFYQNPGY